MNKTQSPKWSVSYTTNESETFMVVTARIPMAACIDYDGGVESVGRTFAGTAALIAHGGFGPPTVVWPSSIPRRRRPRSPGPATL